MRILYLLLCLPLLSFAQEPPKISRYVKLRQETTTDYTIREPGAAFIRVCFSRVTAPVKVRSDEGNEQYTYAPGQWKRATKRGDNTCAMSITGDTAVIEFLGTGKAEIAGYDVGFPQAVGVEDKICNLDDSRPIRCYEQSEPSVFERRRGVARIHMIGGGLCTAWRVGPGNMMLTNNHCASTNEQIAGAEVWFSYEYPTCTGGTISAYKVAGQQLLATNSTLDFALFTVPEVPFGWFGLDVGLLAKGDRIYMLGHPGGKPLLGIVESDANTGGYCQVDDPHRSGFGTDTDYGYLCDSEGGQSGSPVLNYANGRAVGLHHLGGCSATSTTAMNSGVKMAKIWPMIQSFFNGVPPVGNNEVPVVNPPVASPHVTCTDNVCLYSSEGSVADSLLWDFGDQSTSSQPSGTHTYTEPGDKQITLFATRNTVTVSASVVVNVIVPGYNAPPKAHFTCIIESLTLVCTSDSYDPEGRLASWSWRFKDPLDGVWHYYRTEHASHAFAAPGADKYVDLAVKDNTGQQSSTFFASYTIPAPPPPPPVCGDGVCATGETWQTCPADCPAPIVLRYTAKRVQGPNYDVTLTWQGAAGASVNIYRAGAPTAAANDGSEIYRMHKRDQGTTFKVCDAAQCSNTVRAEF